MMTMEKTKFEKECADMCADCHAKGLDICREDADTVQPMFARCGLCGKVFCDIQQPHDREPSLLGMPDSHRTER